MRLMLLPGAVALAVAAEWTSYRADDLPLVLADGLNLNGAPPAIVLVSSRAREDLEECVDDSPARGFIPKSELSGAALEALIG